jgi:hypothetical protein
MWRILAHDAATAVSLLAFGVMIAVWVDILGPIASA